jgi:hypothetical protein
MVPASIAARVSTISPGLTETGVTETGVTKNGEMERGVTATSFLLLKRLDA